MTNSDPMIPFEVDVTRILEVVAKQIYQTPLALLRENAQNAFDAIRMRLHLGDTFDPLIAITVEADRVVVSDNGIGMSEEDLRQHFWKAGSSGKNNAEARAAGVVGTFGIGAMANFGVAKTLTVETERKDSTDRIRSSAARDELSTSKNCITLEKLPLTGNPGTTIVAILDPKSRISVEDAKRYLSDCVALLDVPVSLNGEVLSKKNAESLVQKVSESWRVERSNFKLASWLEGDIELLGAPSGEMWCSFRLAKLDGNPAKGWMVLRQGTGAIKTYRTGFGLAPVNLSSSYNFGGVADLPNLVPTAGREALTTESIQFLQRIIVELDRFCSEEISRK